MAIALGFGPFEGRVWMNTAHQGPLPRPAVTAAHSALDQKIAPARLPDDAFFTAPRELKDSLSRLIGAPADQIILGNSTTYGLDLLAHGLPLSRGDEVLLVQGDFPATITPWLPLERRGVNIRLLEPTVRPLSADELDAHIGASTRVFCSSWVFSFTGEAIDLDAIGRVCHERGVLFVLNGSQAIGTRPIDVTTTPIDALVSCGFKWLCGPYGTGFCWLRPELAERLEYEQAYWLAQLSDGDLTHEGEPKLRDDLTAARYDVFCTANFLNFAPWRASIDLLLEYGIQDIATHNQDLVEHLIAGLLESDWTLVSPRYEPARSTLLVLGHREPRGVSKAHHALVEAGIDTAQRAGRLRLSPHVFNTTADADRALDVLTSL